MDVDLDSSARNRPKIIERLKEVFGEDNILNICTFKSEKPKSALKTVCRGLGLSVEIGGYISSLVPVERGQQWSLKDCYEGNPNEDKLPVTELIKESDRLSEEHSIDFKEYVFMIEGLISGLSSHASGIYLFKNGYIKQNSLMKTPRGDNVTCWEMEDSDWAGGLKYDSLTTECQDKLEVCMELLLKYNKIGWNRTLRDTYNKYLHPSVLDYDNQEMWDECSNGQIIDLFQFITPVGGQCIRKIQPHNILEMTNANSLMRITVEGEEQPVDKFLAYKQDSTLWDKELEKYGVTNPEEIKALDDILGYCYHVPSMQEDVMELCMSPKIAGFTLADADMARKIIAKKKKDKVAELKEKFYNSVKDHGNSTNVANYVWEECIKPQLAYSFSRNHVLPYSAEAVQEMNLYHFYPHVYWNCATLIVNAGMSDEENTKNVQYDKLAKAIYRSMQFGVPIASPDINKSERAFSPLEEENKIFYGLGAVSGLGQEVIDQILSNRPYTSFHDFYARNSYQGSLITQSKFIQLIKAGCFDEFEPNRLKVMKKYIVLSTNKKQSLTMANLPEALKIGAKPPIHLLAPYSFKKYVCSPEFFYGNHPNFKSKKLYWLDEKAMRYFNANLRNNLQEEVDWWVDNETEKTIIVDKALDKFYKATFDNLKEYINTPEFIKQFNKCQYRARLNELVPNQDENHWSFEALSYYDREHELARIDKIRHMITEFDKIPKDPEFITKSYGKRTWRQYRLFRIAGTCIAKNDSHHTITLLDINNNVVQVKMDGSFYAHMKRQISIPDGKGGKTVMDKSWLTRGTCLIVTGYRQDDTTFKVKTYKNSLFPKKIQKIDCIDKETGVVELINNRYGFGEDDD